MGGIVGQLNLHEEQYDPENQGVTIQDVEGGTLNVIENWTKPIGLTTCDTCLDFWITSHKRYNFYRIRLTRPLKEMADNDDFSEFASSTFEAYNPWGRQQQQPFNDGKYRYMAMKRDGSVGYFTHRIFGLFQFMERDAQGNNLLEGPGSRMVATDEQLMGVTMNEDDTRLLVTSEKYVYVYDITGPASLITKYNMEKNCSGERDGNMFFFDAVMVGDDIYGIAKLYTTKARAGIGMNLYRIKSDGRDTWDSCHAVTGGVAEYAGWIDGDGNSVRITRPHAMNRLPGTNSIIMTDIDNRAIRVANVGTTPVHVTTVSYDEDLWNKLYVSKSCDKPQKNGAPRKLPNVRSSNNFLQAGDACDRVNERLCSLAELRSYWSKEPQQARGRTVTTWTDEDCHSCWLHQYGVCFPPSTDDSQSRYTLVGSAWGRENQMLAVMSASTEGLATIQTECTSKSKAIETDVMCCPQPELTTFHGRVLLSNGINDVYQGRVLVKLIRMQPLVSGFKYTTVGKVLTEQDGAFEITFESACDDSQYYLKFALDDDNFEFLSGNNLNVKKGQARSTPKKVVLGVNYEIDAVVRPKACHVGVPATFRGRVWIDDNNNSEMDANEQGYSGLISVKLVRKYQQSPPKSMTEKVVSTNENGMFEITLDTICDDSLYYLKFELDVEDYEFISGDDIAVKSEVGRSSQTTVVHGGQYEINAAVRLETARINSARVP